MVVREDGSVAGKARMQTPPGAYPDGVSDALAAAVHEAAASAGCETSTLAGVGIGAPGAIDPDAGVLLKAPNLEGFDSPFPLARVVAERLGLGVTLVNDVQAGMVAETRLGERARLPQPGRRLRRARASAAA